MYYRRWCESFQNFDSSENKKSLLEEYGENSTIKTVEDVTKEYFTSKTVEMLNDSLLYMSWGEGERV